MRFAAASLVFAIAVRLGAQTAAPSRPTGTGAPEQNSAAQNSATGGVQDSSTVRDLPSNGRDWTQAATLQAGVSKVKTQQDASDSNSGPAPVAGLWKCDPKFQNIE